MNVCRWSDRMPPVRVVRKSLKGPISGKPNTRQTKAELPRAWTCWRAGSIDSRGCFHTRTSPRCNCTPDSSDHAACFHRQSYGIVGGPWRDIKFCLIGQQRYTRRLLAPKSNINDCAWSSLHADTLMFPHWNPRQFEELPHVYLV